MSTFLYYLGNYLLIGVIWLILRSLITYFRSDKIKISGDEFFIMLIFPFIWPLMIALYIMAYLDKNPIIIKRK